jgi:superfamily I DNA/RNA helicase/RecB family exonuclease
VGSKTNSKTIRKMKLLMSSLPHWSEALNEAQRRAVEFDSGPVAVLAGPGTGKTRVITHRIARLIHRDGVQAESIGAMTFTVKAAQEMRHRLGSLVGDNAASRVSASTFHGFGRRILLRWGDVIGLSASHDLMDSVQQMRLLKAAVGDATAEGKISAGMLADGGRDAVAARSLAWIEHLRTSALFPDDASALVQRWDELVDQGGPADEPWDADRLDAERERSREFACAVEVYRRYETMAMDKSLLSFDDFILLPIRILRHSERIRTYIVDELRHLVVDEFQDVNGAQLAFLKELSRPSVSGDLCVVGDDDQAIYGFRGSDDRAFQHFKEIWTDAETVPLTENYRSTEAVLETAQRIISASHDRFEPDKVIHAYRTFENDVPSQVEALHVSSDSDYGMTIAAMILADRAEHPDRALSSYAVIGSSHNTCAQIGRVLELEGIAVDDSMIRKDEEDEAVLDVKAWIAAVVGASNISLTRLLVRPPVSMPTDRAIKMQDEYESHRRQAKVEDHRPVPMPVWLAERSGEHDGLAVLSELLNTLRDLSTTMNAEGMVKEIIERTGVAHRELPNRRLESVRIAALVRFLQFVQDLQRRLDAPGDLAAFLRYYNELTPKEQLAGPASFEDIDGKDDAEFDGSGVCMLTAHSSKGLEFDTVFVPRIGAAAGAFGNVKVEERAELPRDLAPFEADPRSKQAKVQDEVRRLFYVACTRAERRLVLLSKRSKNASTSMHMFQELAWRGKAPLGPDERGGSVVLLEAEDVVRSCIERGAAIRGADALASESASKDSRSRVISSARRAARRAAAQLLDRAEEGIAVVSKLDMIGDGLVTSARRLAIIEALRHGPIEEIPDWLLGDGDFARELADRLGASREDRAISSSTAPMSPPLRLSYSKISQYIRCPGCFYLRYVLGLSEPSSGEQLVGTVAHSALERFYRQWSEADAEGGALPGVDVLLGIARELFVAESRRIGGADPAQLEQIEAQLRSGYEKLHDTTAEVMMLEENAPFAYRRAEGDDEPHLFDAKLDRVDRTPSGGFRIIDYKTGQAWKSLATPEKDDLQLGIYSLALAEKLELSSPEELEGLAEYWIFSSGQKGVIELSGIDHGKVRKKIDKAITGMLEGTFAPKKGCGGECGMFLGHS